MTEQHPEERRVVVNDRRRIDPETGAPRVASPARRDRAARPVPPARPAPDTPRGTPPRPARRPRRSPRPSRRWPSGPPTCSASPPSTPTTASASIGTGAATVEAATGVVLTALLPVLDDIDRARQHGDLTGAFKAVADQLEATLEKLGLQPYGEVGRAVRPDPARGGGRTRPAPRSPSRPAWRCSAAATSSATGCCGSPLVAVAEPAPEPADPTQDPTVAPDVAAPGR